MAKTGRGGRRNQKLNRPSSSSSSKQPISRTLPEELINQILIRTPVKSLVRFRCVCKSWLLRTLHPRFISMHLNHNTLRNNNNQLMCNTYHYDLATKTSSKLIAYFNCMQHMQPVYYIGDDHDGDMSGKKLGDARKFNFVEFSKEMVLAGSINGVVCLSHCDKEMRKRFVALWNPAINQWKLIKVPGLKCDCDQMYVVTVGLGYDKGVDDYKIIRIVPVVREPDFQEHRWSRVEIYSVNSDSWTDVDGFVPFWPK